MGLFITVLVEFMLILSLPGGCQLDNDNLDDYDDADSDEADGDNIDHYVSYDYAAIKYDCDCVYYEDGTDVKCS